MSFTRKSSPSSLLYLDFDASNHMTASSSHLTNIKNHRANIVTFTDDYSFFSLVYIKKYAKSDVMYVSKLFIEVICSHSFTYVNDHTNNGHRSSWLFVHIYACDT